MTDKSIFRLPKRRILPLLLTAALLSPALPTAAVSASASQAQAAFPMEQRLTPILDRAKALPALKTIIVARDGETVAERGYHGHGPGESANIKSASKSIVSALVGIAIDKGLIDGPDQTVASILKNDLPRDPDPRLAKVTVGHLLSMQAGLQRMSGPNYGRWVASGNWVRTALAAPFDGEPGGDMLYSTASTHLLSAILTKVSGRSTLALAREWLGPVEGFRIGAWDRDPQGIYLGGNQMAMSARSLTAFGELYRNGGRTRDGRQIVSQNWIRQSFQARTQSRFTGDDYGYGWFTREISGETVHYGWGYGGQMLYIVPSQRLTVVMLSDETAPSARTGYRDALHGLLGEIIGAAKAV
ncbi:6-aminohexanoate hydrolase [Rhizobium rhizosphaerae]|uniref:6-aminohexanoate hydrolase n=1 Tax=Xaviernesmea rhizosphaerae TaxID=1672749 RepID=A0ABX3PDV3_9HYPH|nr:serine hydrolase [Xaviernesmea rhizosphaerae]OQP86243.1 6-aminohexanoate hydrolase [Xaviernesmea rhizosphaerae]